MPEIYHVFFLATNGAIHLTYTFSTEADAMNWIHGKCRVHDIERYIILKGIAVRK